MHIYINTHIHSFYSLKRAFQPKQVILKEKKFVKQILRRPVWSRFRLLTVHSWSFSEYLVTKITPSGFKFPKVQRTKVANTTLLCKCDTSLKTDHFLTICYQNNFNLLAKSFFSLNAAFTVSWEQVFKTFQEWICQLSHAIMIMRFWRT